MTTDRAGSSVPGRVTRALVRSAEEHAAVLRQRVKLGSLDPLDPRKLAPDFGIVVAGLDDLPSLSATDRTHLAAVDAKVWSGMGVPLPDGRLVVLLHPRQTAERAAVTIMEEVAHAYFDHRPSHLVAEPSGLVRREYDQAAEDEAYWTAAAALIPALAVARAVWRGRTAASVAAEYGTSTELAQFRIKVRRLWPDYAARVA